MTTHIGSKIAYKELGSHTYVHVDDVDGERLVITEGGQLQIHDGKTVDAPAQWNFVYDLISNGVYTERSALLPTLHRNIY